MPIHYTSPHDEIAAQVQPIFLPKLCHRDELQLQSDIILQPFVSLAQIGFYQVGEHIVNRDDNTNNDQFMNALWRDYWYPISNQIEQTYQAYDIAFYTKQLPMYDQLVTQMRANWDHQLRDIFSNSTKRRLWMHMKQATYELAQFEKFDYDNKMLIDTWVLNLVNGIRHDWVTNSFIIDLITHRKD